MGDANRASLPYFFVSPLTYFEKGKAPLQRERGSTVKAGLGWCPTFTDAVKVLASDFAEDLEG